MISPNSHSSPDRRALTFTWQDSRLLGTLYVPVAEISERGVVVIVGGPQYRIGSHRHFVKLATRLAQFGVTTLCFDFAGMGDSEGQLEHYTKNESQIKAAIDTLTDTQPSIKEIVLYGFCDGATATMLYAPKDKRVRGIVLVNPWLESPKVLAKSMVRSYYLRRLLSTNFWRSILKGDTQIWNSGTEFLSVILDALQKESRGDHLPTSSKLAVSLERYIGYGLVVISTDDATGRGFEDHVTSDSIWNNALSDARFKWLRITGADHTFTDTQHEKEVIAGTLNFIQHLGRSV